jgi:hypothetical protein
MVLYEALKFYYSLIRLILLSWIINDIHSSSFTTSVLPSDLYYKTLQIYNVQIPY